ncbi:MAG: ZIP family metal transporter [Flavobacteriaceae bacterium]
MNHYFLPITAVILGGLSILIWKPKELRLIKLLLAFSGTFLLSITVLEMLPNVYQSNGAVIGYWVLGGIVLQLLLESFSKGAEHGHIHISQSSGLPWAILISLCLHSVLEGIPIHYHDHLAIGIFLHKLPIAMLLSYFLLQSHQSKIQAVALFLLFGISTPLGTYLSSYDFVYDAYVELSALVAGMFLHISTTIIFESADGHRFNSSKIISILLGIAFAVLSTA